MSRRISQAEVDRRVGKGAKVTVKSKPAPKPEPSKKLENELNMVKAKLKEMARKPQKEAKKRFEFTVERDSSGFIKKIHAEEV